jgi:hypothetical protein
VLILFLLSTIKMLLNDDDDDSRAFAPTWLSTDLGLDLEAALDELEVDINPRKEGWVFGKCAKEFEILTLIIEPKKPISIINPDKF